MATMIPEDVKQFTTKGEGKVYRFLESFAKPDSQNIVWYSPDIEGKEPDFILYSDQVGLIIFEVKDWVLKQIRNADRRNFFLYFGPKVKSKTNPYRQVRGYFIQFMNKIEKDGKLLSRNRNFWGKPVIPIEYGVIFTNINRIEYIKEGFDQVIDIKKDFFWDDLHPTSSICSDSSGACFAKALENMFPPKFPFSLTGKDLDHLKQLLFPIVRVDLPKRESKFDYKKRISSLKSLDNHQEALARKFDGGHRILVGPSGSGKTLILVYKADFLMRYNPTKKKILFVCYNITLVNYIKRLLSDKGVSLGDNGVHVFHYYQLCSKIIGEDIAYENETSEYYDLINQEALAKVKDYGIKYDAILVDEGQDFSDDMYKIITALLSPKTENLTIALDNNQDIYRRGSTWKEVGIKARGRVRNIPYIYRNTKQISELATRFIHNDRSTPKAEKTEQLELFPGFFDFSGPKPELRKFRDFNAITEYITSKIKKIVDEEQCPYSEIAIVYCKKSLDAEDVDDIPKRFMNSLNASSILCNWASENYHSKKSYDITTNSVTISTIHSTKGFDYDSVFLVGLDLLEENGWSKQQIINMTYVAITRARYQLFIPYIHKNALVTRLLQCV